jgi:hypothetical protein
MLETLVGITAAICVLAIVTAYVRFRDPFHPLILIAPMFAFIYVYMPMQYLRSGELFTYVSEERAIFVQTIVVASIGLFVSACLLGSKPLTPTGRNRVRVDYDRRILQKGAYVIGTIGLLCWVWTVHMAGGFTQAFGHAYGTGWSDLGYVREAVYLLIVAELLLLSQQAFEPRNRLWIAAVVLFAIPWLLQGLLGARRGPTFVIVLTLGMSWYLARGIRPSLSLVLCGGVILAFLMLFLVTNRKHIYLGGDISNVDPANVSRFLDANEANDYIYGAGCIVAARETGSYYWGRRYLAQILVRPIPRQIWPNKYADFGVGELEQNAGVGGAGIEAVMGWPETPGAAGAAVADLWVEFSWLSIPVMALIGWSYGRVWRRAVEEGAWRTTLYMIFALLSIYFVTQSGEAVIFRFVILTLPARYVWRKAVVQAVAVEPLGVGAPGVLA